MNKKWLDNYGKAENANESSVSLPEGFVGMGYDTNGRSYSPSWNGQFQTGGSLPGSVGFTYARTGDIPSNGKYAKKTMASAQNGQKIQKPIDSTLENVFEIFDPTGISSWDDIYQSYQESGMSPETKYEIFGALPILGKVGKAGKLLSQTSKVNRRKGVMGKGIGTMIQSVPYIGRGTDVLQTVQQALEAPFFPTAPSANVGQFGRYAGSPSLNLKKSEILPARTDVHAGSLQKISDYMNSKSEKKSNEVYGKKSYYSPSEFQNGGEMKFYQEGLDWKPKSMQEGGIVEDDMGYWNPDNHGKAVRINSNLITMDGVYEPLLGVSDEGDAKLMEPGKDYKFKGKKVTEYPLLQKGGRVGINDLDAQPLKKLNQLTNFTNNPDKNWLDKLG
jgi:hypothetical protein